MPNLHLWPWGIICLLLLGFMIWLTETPVNSRFHISRWPIWAKAVWGILTGIAVVRLIHSMMS
jgi:hypothetical protein